MSEWQAVSILSMLVAIRARRFLTSAKGIFLIINALQVALFIHSITHHPGDLSLIVSLVVRLALVSLLANVPPIRLILSMREAK